MSKLNINNLVKTILVKAANDQHTADLTANTKNYKTEVASEIHKVAEQLKMSSIDAITYADIRQFTADVLRSTYNG